MGDEAALAPAFGIVAVVLIGTAAALAEADPGSGWPLGPPYRGSGRLGGGHAHPPGA